MSTCVHCGSDSPRPLPRIPPPTRMSRLARGTGTERGLHAGSDAARLAAVVGHVDYAAAMAFGPSRRSRWDRCLPLVMMASGTLALARTLSATGPGWIGVCAILLALPWFVAAAMLAREAWGTRGEEPRRRIARIVSVDPFAPSPDPERWYVRLQLENGQIRAVPCPTGLATALEPDDVGVAYESGGRLIAFRRFDV